MPKRESTEPTEEPTDEAIWMSEAMRALAWSAEVPCAAAVSRWRLAHPASPRSERR